jgi:hypothetical protein
MIRSSCLTLTVKQRGGRSGIDVWRNFGGLSFFSDACSHKNSAAAIFLSDSYYFISELIVVR